VDKFIFKHRKFDINETLFIAGFPRSGTSWLIEVIANIPIYTQLFEPLNPIFFDEPRKLGFNKLIYLSENAESLEGEEYLL